MLPVDSCAVNEFLLKNFETQVKISGSKFTCRRGVGEETEA